MAYMCERRQSKCYLSSTIHVTLKMLTHACLREGTTCSCTDYMPSPKEQGGFLFFFLHTHAWPLLRHQSPNDKNLAALAHCHDDPLPFFNPFFLHFFPARQSRPALLGRFAPPPYPGAWLHCLQLQEEHTCTCEDRKYVDAMEY